MRYLFSRKRPQGLRILLIESGSRHLLESMLPRIAEWNLGLQLDLLTCYDGRPQGLPDNAVIYYTQDYPTPEKRKELVREFQGREYAYCGMICSEESILFKWKWYVAAGVPAKVFIINENGDYFWLNRENASTVREFVLVRMGLHGAGAIRTLARMVLFPFTLLFLGCYAVAVHAKRRLHLMMTRSA